MGGVSEPSPSSLYGTAWTMNRGSAQSRTVTPRTYPPRFLVPLICTPYREWRRSQSQIFTSSTPPLISLPMATPKPYSLTQSNTRMFRVGRLMTLPSGFLPLLMATESSPV